MALAEIDCVSLVRRRRSRQYKKIVGLLQGDSPFNVFQQIPPANSLQKKRVLGEDFLPQVIVASLGDCDAREGSSSSVLRRIV